MRTLVNVGNPNGLTGKNTFKKHLHFLNFKHCGLIEKSLLSPSSSIPPTPKDGESNMSFSHFLSAHDHLCVGFSQALGTSVYSHPLSLLSTAHYLHQQKNVEHHVCACVCSSEEYLLSHAHRPLHQG